jgi:hypothetical protein
MADADSARSEGADESRRTRNWTSLLAEAYFAIVVIGLVGTFWTRIFHVLTATYRRRRCTLLIGFVLIAPSCSYDGVGRAQTVIFDHD